MRMTWLVISFNRHFFALAAAACTIGISLILLLDNPLLRVVLAVGIGLALYLMVASVIATYVAYDASDLYKLRWWPARALQKPPADAVVVHAGFDPSTPAIAAAFPHTRLRILNFFDPQTRRKRRFSAPTAETHPLSQKNTSQQAPGQ